MSEEFKNLTVDEKAEELFSIMLGRIRNGKFEPGLMQSLEDIACELKEVNRRLQSLEEQRQADERSKLFLRGWLACAGAFGAMAFWILEKLFK